MKKILINHLFEYITINESNIKYVLFAVEDNYFGVAYKTPIGNEVKTYIPYTAILEINEVKQKLYITRVEDSISIRNLE